jgi:penicillin amidase
MTATQVRPEDCLSRHEGEQQVEGLDGAIRIVRDRWGIPHIEATTTHDAFFGQGYCLGQDRLWQLELYRHFAWGTAAALVGRGMLRRDRQNRRLGYGRYAEREWEAQTPEARMILEAYAAGINAAIASNPAPYEFHVLDPDGAVHEMAPWRPVDSLAILKMVSSSAQWSTKLTYSKVAATLGVEAVAAMIADVPEGAALITPSGARWTQDTHPYAEDVEAAMGAPDGVVAAGGGSNCWVIHGSKTDTGRPIVCGDPHLAIGIPAQWYVAHMQCPEFSVAGPCSPGYPGPVYYGHNTKVAWTMTHSQGDRWDLYRERIRQGEDGPEAQFGRQWEPLTRLDETFEVRGGEPEDLTVWETRHGPVTAGDPTSDEEVVAARWGLAEPAHDVDALIAALRASNVAEAREAFRTYDSISGNYCFSDQSGDIAYQYVGRIPKRPAWPLPVPGWSGEYEWDGDVPKEELPTDENPDVGFIVTANNRTTSCSTRPRSSRSRRCRSCSATRSACSRGSSPRTSPHSRRTTNAHDACRRFWRAGTARWRPAQRRARSAPSRANGSRR